MAKGSAWGTFKRLAGMSRGYALWYLVIGILTLLSSVAIIGRTEALKRLMDSTVARDSGAMAGVFGMALLAFLGGSLVDFVKDYLRSRLDQESTMKLQIGLVKRVQRISRGFIDRNHSGDVITRILDNTGEAQSGINRTCIDVLQNVFNITLLMGYLIHLNWQLTIGTVVASLSIPAILVPLSHYQKKIWDSRWKLEGELSAFVQDSVQGGESARAYGMAPVFKERFSKRYRELLGKVLKTECWGQSTNLAVWTLMVSGLFFVIGYGGHMVAQGATTIGSVVAFLISFEQISFPINAIMQAWPNLQKSLGAADRVFEILDAPGEGEGWGTALVDRSGPDQLPITFDSVSFGYEGGGGEVLKGLTFKAEAGKVTAIVGESGSGKSTLLKLLLGMYLPTDGRILLGDRPIPEYSLDSWRECVGYVSQDVCLFTGSVEENIRMGRLGASPTDAREAGAAANCQEFVDGLPGGYGAAIGEKGVMLSGGQRQRIAIARAILKRPRLLLLDEATSALDNESERLVQDALDRFCKGRTTIVVAHRLSTIMNADRIVFLEDGGVVEEGSHSELMEAGGRYRDMFTAAYGDKGGAAV